MSRATRALAKRSKAALMSAMAASSRLGCALAGGPAWGLLMIAGGAGLTLTIGAGGGAGGGAAATGGSFWIEGGATWAPAGVPVWGVVVTTGRSIGFDGGVTGSPVPVPVPCAGGLIPGSVTGAAPGGSVVAVEVGPCVVATSTAPGGSDVPPSPESNTTTTASTA